MKLFIIMLRTSLRQQLQYRSAMLAGMFTQLMFGLIYIMVYMAYYEYGMGTPGMTLAQALGYTWLNQACLRMMSLSGLNDVEDMMRDGRIAFELTRPTGLQHLWFARSMGKRIAPFFINVPLIMLIAFLMPQNMRLVLDVQLLPLGVLSLVLAVLVSASVTVLLTETMFWTVSGEGINKLVPMIATVCSGSLLPLEFFPDVLRDVLRALPFAAISDAPLRILVGAASTQAAWSAIALQLFWLIVLTVLGHVLMQRGVRKCMVQGG